ncbi:MAG: sigma-54-dependent Fis family transcriptional regulator [Candidatus Lindowbacteria bacterium]|nr:sigma-54-dependent Fis family transcriptional regulator [Candidatus Lindowbacteria bacterium]
MSECIRLLIVDDDEPFRASLCECLSLKGHETLEATTAEEALALSREHLLDVAVVDIKMPGMDGVELLAKLKEAHPSIEVIILTGVASIETAIGAMKLGAYDYLSKPFDFDDLRMRIRNAYEKKKLAQQKLLLEMELKRLTCAGEFIGASAKAKEIREFVAKAAKADCPVLLEGESGVGKELVAREVHRQSPRASGPFIVLDCCAYPETLLADELFGHEKGAFTTALQSRAGVLEMSHGGTLLLDEIGEMSPGNQVSLLRLVETNRFRRLGSSKELSVNVHILASTNRNLQNEVKQGRFREDLYYRLAVLHFVVPPLRERRDDIPLLAEYFLDCLNRARGAKKRMRADQKDRLKQLEWKGNIRELANLVERSFFLSSDDELDIASFVQDWGVEGKKPGPTPVENTTLSEIQRDHVVRILEAKKGNKKEAAKALGISRSRLYNLLKRYDIPIHEG